MASLSTPSVEPTAKYTVEVAGPDYWRRQIKCQYACPVGTDARGYVRAIAQGDYLNAYLIAWGPNPIASICGRICGAPCEAACRRGSIDAPIAIRALKRFVTAQYGAEAGVTLAKLLEEIAAKKEWECAGFEELRELRSWLRGRSADKGNGARVAIIGSGPAGLGCAHDLALLGMRPVIYEMEPVPAGMLYVGVPEYRLPRDLIRMEVAMIEALGVEIRCGVQVGKDVSLPDLREEYQAVVICVGAKRSRGLQIPGADAAGIMGGVDLLRSVALGESVTLGQKVVVVGGGSVAYDVARTVLRQEEADVARTAMRQPGVREVNLCSLESLEEMPADETEIVEGEREGVRRFNSLGPKEFLVDGGHVKAVIFRRVLSVYDENRRFAPKYDDSTLTTIEADTVVLAVGQRADLSFIHAERDGLALTPQGNLQVDPRTLQSSAPDVFAAGDVAHGTKLLIDAVASGKQAAREVYRYLTGVTVRPEQAQIHFPILPYSREPGYERLSKLFPPTRDPQARIRSMTAEVELAYPEAEARREASRCLDCGVNTIFDGERCILCGGCVDVCPELCLKIVPLEYLHGSPEVDGLLARTRAPGEQLSVIIKDEDACIRCGLCAERCPTEAITMERFHFAEVWK